MAVTFNTYAGNGTTGIVLFFIQYIDETDVKVSIDGVTQATTAYTFPTASTIQFVSLTPTSSQTIRISVTRMLMTWRLHSLPVHPSVHRIWTITSNRTTLLFKKSKISLSPRKRFILTNVDMNSNGSPWDPIDAQDAVTKQYLEDNYFDDGTETITAVSPGPTTTHHCYHKPLITVLIQKLTRHWGWRLIDSTGLSKSATGGQVTLGIAANSVDLDRIKNSDIYLI